MTGTEVVVAREVGHLMVTAVCGNTFDPLAINDGTASEKERITYEVDRLITNFKLFINLMVGWYRETTRSD